jgi:hypothetical protein
VRRVEAAVVAALLVALMVASYGVIRVIQARLFPEPNPALVVWSTRIGLFWRMGLVAYLALVLSPLALWWARRDLTGASSAAAWAIPAAALIICAQTILVP